MNLRKCSGLVVGLLVLAFVATYSAPAMAQQCSNTISPLVLNNSAFNRVAGGAGATSRTQVRVAFRTNAQNDCGDAQGVSERVTAFVIQPSCNFTNGVCVNDPGQDDGNANTPAVEFESLDATTCPGGLAGFLPPDTTDPYAVRLTFVTPQDFAVDTTCSVDITVHVRERGVAPSLATIGQNYSTDGNCLCIPPLPASGAGSTQIVLTCPSCDDGNVCTTDTCNANTLQCEHSTPPNCDDGNVCTTDACTGPNAGDCSHSTPPDRKSTRLNSSHVRLSRMPSSA